MSLDKGTIQRLHCPIRKALLLLDGVPGCNDISIGFAHDLRMGKGRIVSGEVEMKLLGDDVEVTIN